MTISINPNEFLNAVPFPEIELDDDNYVIAARGRLRHVIQAWLAHRGLKEIPQNDRGRAIIKWLADQAFVANPSGPIRGVRRWIEKLAPSWFTAADIKTLVEYVRTSNKNWSHDHSAYVLDVSLDDCIAMNCRRWIGANDDDSRAKRKALKRATDAERARRRRSRNSTSAKPGRPSLGLSPDEMKARTNAQAAERMKRRRALRKTPSASFKKDVGSVTQLSVTQDTHAAREQAEITPALNSSSKQKPSKTIQPKEEVCLGKTSPSKPTTATARAALPQDAVDKAIELIRKVRDTGHHKTMNLSTNRKTVQRTLERFWPGYVRSMTSTATRFYGSFRPDRDLRSWEASFRLRLEGEGEATNRYLDRRRKWDKRRSETRL